MTDTDVRMADADPADPFDFFRNTIKDHLVAGYSKTTASGGLVVHMPDYSKISKRYHPEKSAHHYKYLRTRQSGFTLSI